jgi:hypothetical protein
LRIEDENAFYHVIARGERCDAIFTCPADKEKFLIKLGKQPKNTGCWSMPLYN